MFEMSVFIFFGKRNRGVKASQTKIDHKMSRQASSHHIILSGLHLKIHLRCETAMYSAQNRRQKDLFKNVTVDCFISLALVCRQCSLDLVRV